MLQNNGLISGCHSELATIMMVDVELSFALININGGGCTTAGEKPQLREY
jgi:hypothetical protein